MDSKQKETIIKLQKLNPNSIEFYDVATSYFSRRNHSDRNCGVIFFLFALLGLIGILPSGVGLFRYMKGIIVILFFGWAGWKSFWHGQKHLVLIKTSRAAGTEYQKRALRHFCRKLTYCSEPIGVFILRQLGEDAQPTLSPDLIKYKKRKQTDEEHWQWMESSEKVLREKINRQLKELT